MGNKQDVLQSDIGEHVVEEVDSPSRRRLLGFLAGTLVAITGAGIAAPLAGMFLSPLFQRRKELWLNLGELKDVAPEQPTRFVYKYVRMDGWFEKTIYGTAYAVRNGANVKVLSNICTHLGCGVRWDDDKKSFLCPCHNGVFDRNGTVVSGPPPKPLRTFTTRIAKGKIQIKVEEA
ncbi:MAG: ubiquinol-cytochrome c reductase iron-sulfur subunit [Armatimonadetes bacterium]|nr:ubiquinol-cytochrome c reductase iron-sulfur subunit [Armatimonadota bacterium]